MQKICYSCSAPLEMPGFKGPAENYCKYCTDDQGNLKPREEIIRGVTEWFKSWHPDVDHEKAAERAKLFLKSMPAWAD